MTSSQGMSESAARRCARSARCPRRRRKAPSAMAPSSRRWTAMARSIATTRRSIWSSWQRTARLRASRQSCLQGPGKSSIPSHAARRRRLAPSSLLNYADEGAILLVPTSISHPGPGQQPRHTRQVLVVHDPRRSRDRIREALAPRRLRQKLPQEEVLTLLARELPRRLRQAQSRRQKFRHRWNYVSTVDLLHTARADRGQQLM